MKTWLFMKMAREACKAKTLEDQGPLNGFYAQNIYPPTTTQQLCFAMALTQTTYYHCRATMHDTTSTFWKCTAIFVKKSRP
jgi:hypothetical protein